MATTFGSAGNDSWTLARGGTYVIDGLGGTDTLSVGTAQRSTFRITQGSDGSVQIDTVSGASQPAQITLFNVEVLLFNNGRDRVELSAYFTDSVRPTATLTDDMPGTARSAITYTVDFSETVTGLAADDFVIAAGSVQSVSGSGSLYTVVVNPIANFEGTLTLTLRNGAAADAAGNTSATIVLTQPVDTRAPSVVSLLPANGAGAVAIGSDLSVTYSEPVRRGSGDVQLRDAAGQVVAHVDAASSALLAISGNVLTFNPAADLAPGATYSLVLPAGSVTDLAGNSAAAPTEWRFTTAAAEALVGTIGNDRLAVGSGIRTVDGGAGVDTAVFAGAHAGYTITRQADGSAVVAAAGGGATTLVQLERVQFDDRSVALDLEGHAGEAVRVLGAVLGAGAVANPTYVGLALSAIDAGMTAEALAQLALDHRLGAGATSAQVVELLFTNLTGTAPTAQQAAPYVALLDSHAYTPGALAVAAAATTFNDTNIDFVGLAAHGIGFV